MLATLTLYHTFLVFLLSFIYRLRGKSFPTDIGHQIGIDWGRRVMAFTPGWHVEISGKEHLPTDSPFILVANHESTADIFAIFLLGIQFKWIAKHELFRIPFLGYCMKQLGYISVKRGDRDAHKNALKECVEWIQKGFSLLFFPEGTRSLDGSPKKFKIGAFKLAIETQSPVLPVVLSGAGRLLKKGSICPNPATLRIKVLPQVTPNEGESIDMFTRRVQQIVVDAHHTLSHKR